MVREILDFLKDQGSALGALATFLAVIAALKIGIWARRDAERQIRVLKEQIDQTAILQKERKAARQHDLIRALGIEAARIRFLAEHRLTVASRQTEASVVNLSRANPNFHEAFKIHTSGLMREGRVSQFEVPLTSCIAACLASVDQLNSLIDVRIGLGQFLDWQELIKALEKVRETADRALTEVALAEETLKK